MNSVSVCWVTLWQRPQAEATHLSVYSTLRTHRVVYANACPHVELCTSPLAQVCSQKYRNRPRKPHTISHVIITHTRVWSPLSPSLLKHKPTGFLSSPQTHTHRGRPLKLLWNTHQSLGHSRIAANKTNTQVNKKIPQILGVYYWEH